MYISDGVVSAVMKQHDQKKHGEERFTSHTVLYNSSSPIGMRAETWR